MLFPQFVECLLRIALERFRPILPPNLQGRISTLKSEKVSTRHNANAFDLQFRRHMASVSSIGSQNGCGANVSKSQLFAHMRWHAHTPPLPPPLAGCRLPTHQPRALQLRHESGRYIDHFVLRDESVSCVWVLYLISSIFSSKPNVHSFPTASRTIRPKQSRHWTRK